jgi:hypothetical protein
MKIRSYVKLNESSRKVLLNNFLKLVNSEWTVYAHHMTIVYNKSLTEIGLNNDIGKEVNLNVTHYGYNEACFAVAVNGYLSTNKTPHITIAVNEKSGGKQVMSNYITDWLPLEHSIVVRGIIYEGYD